MHRYSLARLAGLALVPVALTFAGAAPVMAEASSKQYRELGRAKLLEGGDLFAPLALSNGMLILRDTKQMKCVYVGDGSPVTRADAN